jgi:DNA polymerase-3 subunit alpha
MLQWTDDERLQGEKDTLGLYLTGHPIDQYYDELKRYVGVNSVIYSQHDAVNHKSSQVWSWMYVFFKGPRGTRAIVLLDDRTARVEASFFGEFTSKSKSC